jgi:hypothetical protein
MNLFTFDLQAFGADLALCLGAFGAHGLDDYLNIWHLGTCVFFFCLQCLREYFLPYRFAHGSIRKFWRQFVEKPDVFQLDRLKTLHRNKHSSINFDSGGLLISFNVLVATNVPSMTARSRPPELYNAC